MGEAAQRLAEVARNRAHVAALAADHLDHRVVGVGPVDELDLKRRVAALERRLIRRAMETTGGNQTRAASLLGLSRYGLQKMIKRLGIE